MTSESASTGDTKAVPNTSLLEINDSCRVPLLVMIVSAAVWLVVGSFFSLISSIKFHNPNFLADCAWLTYGRVRPACINAMLYGFGVQAALGVTLWLFARLGSTTVAQPLLVTAGAKLWNLGVTVGVVGILAGDGTGFETLDMPRYATPILFLGYLMIGLWSALTFHQRREGTLFVSHWFLLAALFWFPWIFSTANFLLLAFPVRGVAQAVIAWWYSANLQGVWLGLVGLGAVFYFLPKLTGRELENRYLALLTFWTLLLFASWSGIPNSAPTPAWMPALSTVATVLTVIPVLAVATSVYATLGGKCSQLMATPSLQFVGFGIGAFVLSGLMNVVGSLGPVSQVTDFTWFTAARTQLNGYGFFAMVMFGAIYHIVPQVMGMEFPSAKLVRAHFWMAALGVALIALPLGIGGVVQGFKLQDSSLPFAEVAKATLMFLRVSTIGDLLIALGHLFFALNLGGLVVRYYRARAAAAYAAVTAEIKPAGAQV